jgi:hypothetical protein
MIDLLKDTTGEEQRYTEHKDIRTIEHIMNKEYKFVYIKLNMDETPTAQEKDFINQEIWNKYRGQKCNLGIPFEACLLPGIIPPCKKCDQ